MKLLLLVALCALSISVQAQAFSFLKILDSLAPKQPAVAQTITNSTSPPATSNQKIIIDAFDKTTQKALKNGVLDANLFFNSIIESSKQAGQQEAKQALEAAQIIQPPQDPAVVFIKSGTQLVQTAIQAEVVKASAQSASNMVSDIASKAINEANASGNVQDMLNQLIKSVGQNSNSSTNSGKEKAKTTRNLSSI